MESRKNLSEKKLSEGKSKILSSLPSSNGISNEHRAEKDAKEGSVASRESFKLSNSSNKDSSSNFISKINPKFVYKDSSKNHIMPKIIEEFTETTAQTQKRPKKTLKLRLNKQSRNSKPFYPTNKTVTQKASSLSPNRPDQMNFSPSAFKDLVVEDNKVETDVYILNELKSAWVISDYFSDFQIIDFLENFKYLPNFGNLEEKRKEYLNGFLIELSRFLVKEKKLPNMPKPLTHTEMKNLEQTGYPEKSTKYLVNLSKNAKTSCIFQKYLKITSYENIDILIMKLRPEIYNLCFNKFGNYIVQILIERSLEFRYEFLQTITENFETMVIDEYPARVLQKYMMLGEKKVERMAIEFLTYNPDFFLNNVSSVILLNKLILITKNEVILDTIKKFFKNVIIMNPFIIQTHRHFIRILMNLFTVMDRNEISVIFFYLKDFIEYFAHHQFGMYVLQKVIEKEVKPFDLMIKSYLVQNYSKIYEVKQPKYVIFRALEFEYHKNKGGIFALEVLKGIVMNKDELEKITAGKENITMFLASLFGISGKEFSHTLVLVVNTLLKIISEKNKKIQCKLFFSFLLDKLFLAEIIRFWIDCQEN